MKKTLVFLACAIAFFGTAQGLRAADFTAPQGSDGYVTIGASENHKNLYTAGGNLAINGNTAGDLVAAGANMVLEGNVEKDALLAGGTLILNGNIGEDVRIAGGNISISSPIGGDLVVFGGNVTLFEKSRVGGDLVAAGGNININAPVSGNLRVGGGNVRINSRVEGNVWVNATQSLTFGPAAKVEGKIIYKGVSEAKIENGASVGSIEFTQMEKRDTKKAMRALFTLAFLVKLVAWFLAGFLVLRLLKPWVNTAQETISRSPWMYFGIGVIGAVVVPVIFFLLLLTLVGYYIAFLLLGAYILGLAIAAIFSAILLGRYLARYMQRGETLAADWQVVALGVVALSLVKIIPIVGWLAAAVLMLMCFGVGVAAAWRKLFSGSELQ